MTFTVSPVAPASISRVDQPMHAQRLAPLTAGSRLCSIASRKSAIRAVIVVRKRHRVGAGAAGRCRRLESVTRPS